MASLSQPRVLYASCLTVFLIFATSVVGGLLGGAALWFGLARHQPRATQTAELPVYPREEFARLVLDHSPADLLSTLGRPSRTSTDSDTEYWHYFNRTRDPVTGRLDSDVQVIFRDGKVVDVNF